MSKTLDLTGQIFGKLNVVSFYGKVNGVRKFLCICECGKETVVSGTKLVSGHTKSCGCYQRERASESNTKDYFGTKIGRWTLVKKIDDGYRSARYLCRCECGTEKVLQYQTLSSGKSKSCGCYRSEIAKITSKKHGLSSHPLYRVWSGIVGRTSCKSNSCYDVYGMRGIRVCDEWRDFSVFFQWAIDNHWKHGQHIDRINNSEGYSPNNCRIVSPKQNQRNRKSNRHLTVDGITKCLCEWSEIYGVPASTIEKRIDLYGWSVKRAVTEKPKE